MLLKEFLDFEIYNINAANIKNVCFGNNEKNTLIVLRQNDYSDENKELLAKMLQAVKYDVQKDIVLCLLEEEDKIAISQLTSTYVIQRILLFGVDNDDLHLNILIPNYKPTVWNNITLIKIDSLTKIAASTKLKGALWQGMKAMF